jgi:hypothetical protein
MDAPLRGIEGEGEGAGADGSSAPVDGADAGSAFETEGAGDLPVKRARAARNRPHMPHLCPLLAHQQGNPDYVRASERTPPLVRKLGGTGEGVMALVIRHGGTPQHNG